jgi:hypothetical protein
MKTSSWKAIAYALLAVALWASVATSGNAEPARGDHGWVEAGVALAGTTTRVEWSSCATLTEGGGAAVAGPCPLDWRLRGLMIGGAGLAAEHLRTRLPVVTAIIAERGDDLGHWLALLPWNRI